MKMIDEIDGEADLARNGKESDIELEREDTDAAYGVDGAAATSIESIERTSDAKPDEDACECRCDHTRGGAPQSSSSSSLDDDSLSRLGNEPWEDASDESREGATRLLKPAGARDAGRPRNSTGIAAPALPRPIQVFELVKQIENSSEKQG